MVPESTPFRELRTGFSSLHVCFHTHRDVVLNSPGLFVLSQYCTVCLTTALWYVLKFCRVVLTLGFSFLKLFI